MDKEFVEKKNIDELTKDNNIITTIDDIIVTNKI